jgi:hypothetical protein
MDDLRSSVQRARTHFNSTGEQIIDENIRVFLQDQRLRADLVLVPIVNSLIFYPLKNTLTSYIIFYKAK